jgi:4-oxalocrotonate tautomerase
MKLTEYAGPVLEKSELGKVSKASAAIGLSMSPVQALDNCRDGPKKRVVLKSRHLTLYRRTRMPFVNVKVIEGVFSAAQKQEMIRKLTDTMVSIEGEAMRSVTWVVVEEVKSGDWGIGGNPLTTSDVKALAAGKPKG